MTDLSINPRVAQGAIQMASRLLATFAIVQGITIIIGGPHRWSGFSYAVALLVPGAPATWGVALLAAGGIALWGSIRDHLNSTALGLFAGGTWCIFFALSFATGAWLYRDANTTAMWTYGVLGILFILTGTVYHQSREHR